MKPTSKPITVSAAQVPPYCYRLPGMSPEEAALVAVKEMVVTHLGDAIGLLWELRREAQEIKTGEAEYPHNTGRQKTCQRAGKTVRSASASETQPAFLNEGKL